MIGLAIASLFLGYTQNSPSEAPVGPICFVLNNSNSTIPVDDVSALKSVWKSKEIVKLKSGNFGLFSSGCYYIITKDTPLLKEQIERFLLAKKVVQLAVNKKSKGTQHLASGSDFTDSELKTLSLAIDRWTGCLFSESELRSAMPLLFNFGHSMSFSSNGESISVQPAFQFPSADAFEEWQKSRLSSGTLREPSEKRHFDNRERHKNASILGGEAVDGGLTLKVFYAMSERPDYSGMQKNATEVLEKAYAEQTRTLRQAMVEISQPLRNANEFFFEGFTSQGVADNDNDKTKTAAINQSINERWLFQVRSRVAFFKDASVGKRL